MMISNQEKYVPSCVVERKKQVLSTVGFHGHQLFEERARNVQWTFRYGNTNYERLEGLSTEFADWHAKITLHKVRLEFSKDSLVIHVNSK